MVYAMCVVYAPAFGHTPVSNLNLTDQSLGALRALVSVEHLDLWGLRQVTDEGLAHLCGGDGSVVVLWAVFGGCESAVLFDAVLRCTVCAQCCALRRCVALYRVCAVLCSTTLCCVVPCVRRR